MRLNVGDTQRAIAAATDRAVPAVMQERLAALWPQHEASLLSALEARMRERGESLGKHLADRAAKEAEDIATILNELKRSIEAELKVPAVEQLMLPLFSDDERAQLERNVASLRARVAQIPAEIEAETIAIHARYADPRPRLFPVAVTFLVPERLTR